jgi:hypothetical protein
VGHDGDCVGYDGECVGHDGACERKKDEIEKEKLWCSGDIIDWELINELDTNPRKEQNKGSINPSHWWWKPNTTDRVQEPTLIADIQTHDTYFNSISHLFNPMRTLNLGPQNPNS